MAWQAQLLPYPTAVYNPMLHALLCHKINTIYSRSQSPIRASSGHKTQFRPLHTSNGKFLDFSFLIGEAHLRRRSSLASPPPHRPAPPLSVFDSGLAAVLDPWGTFPNTPRMIEQSSENWVIYHGTPPMTVHHSLTPPNNLSNSLFGTSLEGVIIHVCIFSQVY